MKGTVIGQYRITELLGVGGMGMVYAAEHTLLGRPAAMKLLLPELSSKQEIVQRFFNEARAATAIRHPGIVEIYDFGWTNDGSAFIVMELLQGETLRARRERGPMPWSAALAVTRQIAGALGAAHAKGIVHRDLKPDNVFLVPDPEVPGGERIKLLDFGIAKLASSSAGHHRTRTGAVIGTPSYMAPEQCRGVAVDSRADLYALGCILFELCSGRPPFVGEGEGDVLAAHIHMPPPALGTVARGVPKPLEALVQRLLVKPPTERVQTAEEVVRQIDAVSASTGGGRAMTVAPLAEAPPPKAAVVAGTVYADTTLSSAVTSRHGAGARPPRQRMILIGAAGGVVGLAGVIIALAIGGGGDVPAAGTSVPYGAVAAGSPDASAEPAPPSPAPPPAQPPAASAPAPAPAPTPPPETETATAPAPAPAPATTPATTPAPTAATVEKTPPGTDRAPDGTSAKEARSPARPAISRPAPEKPAPPPPSTVEVVISSSPAGAEILRGGKVIGKTPFHDEMKRSSHDVKLVLRLRGHQDQPITVRPNAPSKQHVKLAPAAHDKGVNPF